MKYIYETHCHTAPVSKCARASARETVEFYKSEGYDGLFITNHFLDGNVNIPKDSEMTYAEKIEFYFSDYEEAHRIGEEIGLKVFPGVELSCCGSDFLIYGLDKEWYIAHPEIIGVRDRSKLITLIDAGALVVHAHPFREASYIDHIRLFPQATHAVEVINGGRTDFENRMAGIYAKEYGFRVTAGSDNHRAGQIGVLAGIETDTPINCVRDYIDCVLNRNLTVFCRKREVEPKP